MYSLEAPRRIRAFELLMGHSHQCNGCGATFLQHEDGCPLCGMGAHVTPLRRDCSPEGEKGPIIEIIYFLKDGTIESPDFSPWPPGKWHINEAGRWEFAPYSFWPEPILFFDPETGKYEQALYYPLMM